MRRGATLVEAVVFSLVALAVLIALFTIIRNTQKEVNKTTTHLRGIQAVNLVLGRLAPDVRGAVRAVTLAGPRGLTVRNPHTVELVDHAVDPAKAQPIPPFGAGGLELIGTAAVGWRFDPRTHRVTRTHGEEPPFTVPARFRALAFRRVAAGRPAGADDPLEMKIEWVAEELLDRPASEQGEVLVATVLMGLEGEALARRHQLRIVNPTSLQRIAPLDR